MALALFAGCGAPAGNSASPSSSAAQESQSAAKDSYTVAIAQYAQHGSLDNCREGFIDGLKPVSYTHLDVYKRHLYAGTANSPA